MQGLPARFLAFESGAADGRPRFGIAPSPFQQLLTSINQNSSMEYA
jgi:hypothetical protein